MPLIYHLSSSLPVQLYIFILLLLLSTAVTLYHYHSNLFSPLPAHPIIPSSSSFLPLSLHRAMSFISTSS